jgi:hypothetical protein
MCAAKAIRFATLLGCRFTGCHRLHTLQGVREEVATDDRHGGKACDIFRASEKGGLSRPPGRHPCSSYTVAGTLWKVETTVSKA